MASLRQAARAANSATLEEAKRYMLDFYRMVCREVPYVVKQYSLQELVTVQQLRSNIGEMFRKNAHVTDPKVIDILVMKAREELQMALLHHKQRHHLVTQYVSGAGSTYQAKPTTFLESFYASN